MENNLKNLFGDDFDGNINEDVLNDNPELVKVFDDSKKTINHLDNPTKVFLNKKYLLGLGDTFDIYNNAASNKIEFLIENKEKQLLFDYNIDTINRLPYILAQQIISPTNNVDDINNLSILKKLYYLNAERIGPRVSHDVEIYDYTHCGWQGENTITILNDLDLEFKVARNRWFVNTKNPSIRAQTNHWMQFVVPETRLDFEAFEDIDKTRVHYDKRKPYNVGFGISYILPIIVTGLIAEEGSIFIVENPEAHLHPHGQSQMGKFLAMVAAAGVQVIVETHSEHVINGMRVAAVTDIISNENITINFFSKKGKEHQIKEITINERGELSDYPFGFFDQALHDQATMIKAVFMIYGIIILIWRI